ncbi:hypothetical protein LJ754_04215 [Arthrobacter sp. zg-Y40]|uniref:hypothetical protein n=1 Tax=Arthrobacter sp. zg-Y40 TaxID=2886939 RepID=UPI001D143C22|nr:hypothetical protein [Arthrobacter sp. zg-Y40]MCC3278362.1 hypothetical protein [Arthrobacter sp. zg-Y40]
MSWTDERPAWLPPIPSPHRGLIRITLGMILVCASMVTCLVIAAFGALLSMYLLWPLAIGLLLLMSGLLSRRRGA